MAMEEFSLPLPVYHQSTTMATMLSTIRPSPKAISLHSSRASQPAIPLQPVSRSNPKLRILALASLFTPRQRRSRSGLPARAGLVATAAMPALEPKARVLVAGGGIGGLVFALAAQRKGFKVLVLERETSAIRGEGRCRGPIQLQSSALAALEAIDVAAADEIMDAGCVTGNRVNGIVDGVAGSWYIKFDMFTPAAERGLPVTRVISRMTLQQILARAVGDDAILNGSHVVDFIDDGSKVTAILEDGRKFEGDLLVGADGIWSKVRKKLFGHSDTTYSGYTCYTGIVDFVPPDVDTVGYRVFLGHKKYLVFTDVGASKMQWYAFHNEEAGGTDPENGKKKRLLEIFDGWCDIVIDLINATDEESILRRDIYDRPPTMNWGKGRVTLLGDSVHAMQPNLGQGGCMAVEDGYELAAELENAWQESAKTETPMDIVSSLRRYEKERRLRVAVMHGLARMLGIMATMYKPYLGVGLGPLSLRIPHPGIVGGRFFIKSGMPAMLSWVLGGNSSKLEGRPLSCRLSDKANDQLYRWLEDDVALEEAVGGEWYLIPMSEEKGNSLQPIRLIRDDEQGSLSVGSQSDRNDSASSLSLSFPQISGRHAAITWKNKVFYLTDLRSEHGTWITENEGRRYRVPPNYPVRFRPSDVIEFGSDKKAMFRVKVLNKLPCESARSGKQQGSSNDNNSKKTRHCIT